MASSKVDALTDLAAALVVTKCQRQTEKSTSASAVSIEDDIRAIEEQIERVPDTAKLSTSDRSKLDLVGTELWNICRIHVMEAGPDDEVSKTTDSRVLALAVALLDLASPSNAPGHIRVLEVTFEASRVCIDTDQLDCALKILKVAAKRFDSLEGDAAVINHVQLDSITAEYYMLRVYLACKQGRPDIADHLFTKVPLKATINNRSTIFQHCLCIGRMALEAGQHGTAVKWLEIALRQLQENQDDESPSSTLSRYMSTAAPELAAKFEGQMDVLKTYGENPAVKYLELDIMLQETRPKSHEFFQTLRALIDELDYTEKDFQKVFFYIIYSMFLSFGLVFEMYQSLLKSVPLDKRKWIEDCFLRLPQMIVTMTRELDIPDEICITVMKDAVAILETRGIECMSQETTDGFFTILLSLLQKSDGISCQHVAEKWCQLALDSKVFQGRFISANLSLQKRLVTVCFDNNNVALARQILDHIVAKNDKKCDPEVQCLLFKLALHDRKDVSVKDYLCKLSSHSSHFDQLNFLRSCAVAAEELNNSRVVINCIQEFMRCTTLVEGFPEEVPVEQNGVECKGSLSVADFRLFPLLFLFDEMEKGHGASEMDVLDLVKSALRWVKRGLSSKNAAFSSSELESVGLYSYDLVVHVFNMFLPEGFEEVLELTKEIFDLSLQRHESIQTANPLPMPSSSRSEGSDQERSNQEGSDQHEGSDEEEGSDPLPLGLIAYQFHYFEINARIFCVNLTQMDANHKLQHYARIFEAIKTIRNQTSEYSASHPLSTSAVQSLSLIEFEAAVALKQWSAITSIVRESEKSSSATVFSRFMDLIVTSEMPDAHRATTIKTMLEVIHRAEEVPPAVSDRLSGYSHFLFMFALAAARSEDSARLSGISQTWPDAYYDMAESVVDEFLKSAGDTSDPKPDIDDDVPPGDSSPAVSGRLESPTEEECLYLAKCSFNQAMDFYSAENDEACLRWAEKAVLLAESVRTPEGEELVSLFRKRLEGLF